MENRMRLWIIYGICAVGFMAAGVWAKSRLARSSSDLETVERQLEGVRALLGEGDLEPAADRPADDAARHAETIGAAVQRAAGQSQLRGDSIQEVKAAGPHSEASGGGGPAAYRVRITGARVEALVRFIYVLEADMALRTIELEMAREGGRAERWAASLLILRAS